MPFGLISLELQYTRSILLILCFYFYLCQVRTLMAGAFIGTKFSISFLSKIILVVLGICNACIYLSEIDDKSALFFALFAILYVLRRIYSSVTGPLLYSKLSTADLIRTFSLSSDTFDSAADAVLNRSSTEIVSVLYFFRLDCLSGIPVISMEDLTTFCCMASNFSLLIWFD